MLITALTFFLPTLVLIVLILAAAEFRAEADVRRNLEGFRGLLGQVASKSVREIVIGDSLAAISIMPGERGNSTFDSPG